MKSLLMATTLFLILLGFVSPSSTLKSKASSTDVELPHLDQSQYIGSQKCEACHKSYFDSWKVSAHNKMIRPAIFEGPDRTVVADFSKPSEFRPFEMKDVMNITSTLWLEILYLGLLASCVNYALWYYALGKLETSKVAIFQNLQPVLTTIIALILGKVFLTPELFGGGALALIGVLLVEKG